MLTNFNLDFIGLNIPTQMQFNHHLCNYASECIHFYTPADYHTHRTEEECDWLEVSTREAAIAAVINGAWMCFDFRVSLLHLCVRFPGVRMALVREPCCTEADCVLQTPDLYSSSSHPTCVVSPVLCIPSSHLLSVPVQGEFCLRWKSRWEC